MPSHMMHMCAKFHINCSTTLTDITSHEIDVHGEKMDGWTAQRDIRWHTQEHIASAMNFSTAEAI